MLSTAGYPLVYMYKINSKRDFEYLVWLLWYNQIELGSPFPCHKCITLAILWHKHEVHSIVCTKVWFKKNSREIHSFGEGRYKIVLKGIRNVKLASYIHKAFHHYFVPPFTKTVNFSGILFDPHFVHTMECTSCLCTRLLMWCIYDKENGEPSSIGYITTTRLKYVKVSFGIWFYTYRTSGYQQYLHILWLKHLTMLNHILPTYFSEIWI